ncbi:MAG: hypothetical protein M3167_06165 [Acidobacteriota bacterium]|nr:hypothetical protein [Acidobacteriota bacterium]MDQ6892249.1 hypothetical protein [Acidobacteriota bacterium]
MTRKKEKPEPVPAEDLGIVEQSGGPIEPERETAPAEEPAGDVRKKTLRVKLTDAETSGLAHELAEALVRLEHAEQEKKDEASAATEHIKGIQKTVDRLRDEIRDGEVNRSIDVRREADYGAALWRFFRVDTGEELTPEKMNEEDRQSGLFDQQAADAAANEANAGAEGAEPEHLDGDPGPTATGEEPEPGPEA